MTWVPKAENGAIQCRVGGCDRAVIWRPGAGRPPEKCPDHADSRSRITETEFLRGEAEIRRVKVKEPALAVGIPGVGSSMFWQSMQIAVQLGVGLPSDRIAEDFKVSIERVAEIDLLSRQEGLLKGVREGDQSAVGRAHTFAAADMLGFMMANRNKIPPQNQAFALNVLGGLSSKLAPETQVQKVEIRLPETEEPERGEK